MKTAVDKVQRGKARTINARFLARCGHYLFEPDFCNVASRREKGVVEKMCKIGGDRFGPKLQIAGGPPFAELNDWLAQRCKQSWETMAHPQWAAMTIADVLQDERMHLLPVPKALDAYECER